MRPRISAADQLRRRVELTEATADEEMRTTTPAILAYVCTDPVRCFLP
jgi:hypothetical protein